MAFELYDPDEPRHHVESVTLMKAGRLALSSATFKRYWDGKRYALLFFDKQTQRIGIKPVADPVKSSYEIAEGLKGNHQIGATAFCKKFGIKHEKARKFPVQWDEKEQMVIIQLYT